MLLDQQSWSRLFPQIVAWRRYLHRNPELSFQEVKTAAFVSELLQSCGLEVRTGVGGHGVTALLRGSLPGPTVALRADMDALPIQDEKVCDYTSTVKGVMHACGHDAHTATLLGVAKWMAEHRGEMAGNIRFIFQHAEEISPGGAGSMIEDGVLHDVDVVYGVHLWTPFQVGSVYSVAGPFMAAADEFRIEIKGKGGHGGLPHQTVDSILTGAQLAINLQSIVSRNVNPLEPCVVSVGSLHAGSSFNIIPDNCQLIGTVRTFNEDIRDQVVQRIGEIARHTCLMYGADHVYEYKKGYPPVVNHAYEADRFYRVGKAAFGDEHVKTSPLIMAGEDFAYYLNHRPGCFFFVGAGNEQQGIVYPHHHPRFDIDEQAMLHSGKLMISMAFDYIKENSR